MSWFESSFVQGSEQSKPNMATKSNQKKTAKKGAVSTPAAYLPSTTSKQSPSKNDALPESSQGEDGLIGYIHDVSPTKLSAKGATYFSFSIQNKNQVSKAICFSPEKRKLVQSKAESCSPCKLTKYNRSDKQGDQNVVWINRNTRIDDAPDTIVDFPYTKIAVDVPTSTSVADLGDVKVNQLITLTGQVIFEGSTVEEVGKKKCYKKREGYFVDHTGSIPFTVWNETIQLLEDGAYYEADNVRLRQYNSEKYVSSTTTSVFKNLAVPPQTIPDKIVADAKKKASQSQTKEIPCDDIQSVNILQFYSCVGCSKRVQSRPDSVMTKCDNCQVRFLLAKSQKSITARICIKATDDQLQWFSLFPPALEEIVAKYANDPFARLETLDEEKLSEIILLASGMKLIVNNSNVVNNVKFD